MTGLDTVIVPLEPNERVAPVEENCLRHGRLR
jgi:hypothetical protein